MPRQEPSDTLEGCPLPRDIPEAQKLLPGARVEARGNARLEQRLLLGGEIEIPVVNRVVEGFDAETVARQEQASLPRVPNGEGEHSVESAEHLRPMFDEQIQQHLGVRLR